MEYVYAAMLLHKAGQQITEESMKKVMDAAGVKPDEVRIKALVAALEGINIDEAIEKAAFAPVASASGAVASDTTTKAEEKKEEKKEEKEEEASADDAAAGLGALFG